MDNVYSHVFTLHDECVRLCEELQECLHEERRAVIELRMESLPQLTLRKESLVSAISKKRQDLREFVRFRFSAETAEDFARKLPAALVPEWESRRERWNRLWKATREACERNQSFLEHSVKNLGQLVDNLKRAFGDTPLYSNTGRKVESSQEGKVLQGKF